MNKRILKIFNEAGFHQPEMERLGIGDKFEKFAELIVKECAWAADFADKNPGDYVLKHFGVEETKGWVCSKCGVDRTKDVCPKGHIAAVTGDCPMIAVAQ